MTRTIGDGLPAVFGAIVAGWKWRSRTDGDVEPAAMETRHLFYTLRMVWNHTMPGHMTVGRNVKRWSFGARHSPQYLQEAVVQIGAELLQRDDLAPWMREELEEMAYWLNSEPRRLTGDGALEART